MYVPLYNACRFREIFAVYSQHLFTKFFTEKKIEHMESKTQQIYFVYYTFIFLLAVSVNAKYNPRQSNQQSKLLPIM